MCNSVRFEWFSLFILFPETPKNIYIFFPFTHFPDHLKRDFFFAFDVHIEKDVENTPRAFILLGS